LLFLNNIAFIVPLGYKRLSDNLKLMASERKSFRQLDYLSIYLLINIIKRCTQQMKNTSERDVFCECSGWVPAAESKLQCVYQYKKLLENS
jgi:hypothetical protein